MPKTTSATPALWRELAKLLLERERHALIALSPSGHLVTCNARARRLLAARDGFELDGTRVLSGKAIAPAFRRPRAHAGATLPAPAQLYRVRRPSGAVPYAVRAAHIESRRGSWILLAVGDPDEPLSPCVEACESLFDCTPAEARIAALVCRGLGVPGLSEALGLSRYTVRTHLKSVFRKFAVRSQSQLVARIAQLTPLVTSAPADGASSS